MYNNRLTILQKISLRLRGYAYTRHRKKPGWKGEMAFYVANCPIHGLVETYASGGRGRLQCPLCPIIPGRGANVVARVWYY